MRLWVAFALVALGCGGSSAGASFEPVGGGPAGGGESGGAEAGGGSKSMLQGAGRAGKGGTEPGGGGSGGVAGAAAQGGTAGAPAAGTSHGGSSGAAAGDGGTSGASHSDGGAGGEGGASTPAPDDTGCVERPSVGDALLPGLDCSSCTNGAELGYSVPTFCEAAQACSATVDVTTLGHDDVFLLLPPGSEQVTKPAEFGGAYCKEQSCADQNHDPKVFAGYINQLMLVVPAGHSIKITTDADRAVLSRDNPLFDCAGGTPGSSSYSCAALGKGSWNLVIVVKPNAPRGWARITLDTENTCQ